MKYLKKMPKRSSNKASAPEPMEVDSSPSVSAPPCTPGTSSGITGRDAREEESMEVVPEMIDVNEKMECESSARGKKRKCKRDDSTSAPPLKRTRKAKGTKRKSRWHDGALRKRAKISYCS